jgi:hypothetical protein
MKMQQKEGTNAEVKSLRREKEDPVEDTSEKSLKNILGF